MNDEHSTDDALLAQVVEALPSLQSAQRGVVRPVVGLAGSVAVGKSTFAQRLVEAALATGRSVTVVGTDGFLRPNDWLEERGLLLRKGYPESYDTIAIGAFITRALEGSSSVVVPHYSHERFDIDGEREVTLGDVVVLEGVNVLQPPHASLLTTRLYMHADEFVILGWFAERFRRLIQLAEHDAASFYCRFVPFDADGRERIIQGVWDSINAPNLTDHIAPSMASADMIIHMHTDHSIARLGFPDRPNT